MRSLKLSVSLLALLALCAVAAASASAAPEFLPGTKGTTLTGKSKKAKVQILEGPTVECTGSKASGELLSKTEASIKVTFEGCKSVGLAANSPGSKSGIILAEAKAQTCYINLSPLEAGLLFIPSLVTIEVPAAELTIEVTGDFVGKIEPINTVSSTGSLTIAQKGAVQTIDGCRNASNELVKHTLVAVVNGMGPKQAALEAVESVLSYGAAQELMA